MNESHITRRAMMKSLGAVGLALALDRRALGDENGAYARGRGIIAYRRSSRGRKASNAVKKHNANHLYATRLDAESDAVHPGDPSHVVAIFINRDLHRVLFSSGRVKADLRKVRFARP